MEEEGSIVLFACVLGVDVAGVVGVVEEEVLGRGGLRRNMVDKCQYWA